MPVALVRSIPDCFDRALVREVGQPIDVALARLQHDAYHHHLLDAGYDVETVPTDEAHPDCVFIEDTAVVVGGIAVVTRPGADQRRGETEPVASALSAYFPIMRIEAPGTLDGGDVFLAEDTVYVGRSTRSNDAGIEQLRSVAAEQGLSLIVVPVHDVLHLKSAVLPIDPETVVVTPRAVDEGRLAGLRIIYEADEERHRFSALPLRNGSVLVTATAPITASRLVDLGHHLVPVDVSQIQAADGGLTCMSILF